MQVAFLGLGVMGGPMAGHLARQGHAVRVFNRTRSKAQSWASRYGGAVAHSAREAAQGADVVCVCVGRDDDVREVVYDQHGALAGMRPGAILLDHTTTSATLAREVAAAARARGVDFLDAPVSGGQAGAEAGRLTVLVGGDAEVLERAKPVLSCYARAVTRIGDAGSGQLAKMVNQLCIAGVLQGLSEGLHFAKKAGLDTEVVVQAISQGAAQSWQMENRHRTMARGEFEFGFAVDWMRKDLGICLEEAKENGASLPLAALVDQLYARVQARGGHRWDTSSLIDLLDRP